jgi:hypothetical protein
MELMLFLIKKLLPFFIFLGVVAAVIYFVEPPKSWTQASNFQILIFFIPLLLTFTFFINIFLNFLPWSFIVGLGLMMLVVLWAIGTFTYLSLGMVVFLTAICIKLFPKFNYPRKLRMNPFRKRLTSDENIPKLTPKS